MLKINNLCSAAAIVILLIMLGAFFTYGKIWLNSQNREESSVVANESVDTATTSEDEDGLIQPIYFVSFVGDDALEAKCPVAKNINWNIAVIALSDYMQYGPGVSKNLDFGPAEMQFNFAENCARDMKVYNDAIAENPSLLEQIPPADL